MVGGFEVWGQDKAWFAMDFSSERGELSFLSPSTLESLKNIKPRQT